MGSLGAAEGALDVGRLESRGPVGQCPVVRLGGLAVGLQHARAAHFPELEPSRPRAIAALHAYRDWYVQRAVAVLDRLLELLDKHDRPDQLVDWKRLPRRLIDGNTDGKTGKPWRHGLESSERTIAELTDIKPGHRAPTVGDGYHCRQPTPCPSAEPTCPQQGGLRRQRNRRYVRYCHCLLRSLRALTGAQCVPATGSTRLDHRTGAEITTDAQPSAAQDAAGRYGLERYRLV